MPSRPAPYLIRMSSSEDIPQPHSSTTVEAELSLGLVDLVRVHIVARDSESQLENLFEHFWSEPGAQLRDAGESEPVRTRMFYLCSSHGALLQQPERFSLPASSRTSGSTSNLVEGTQRDVIISVRTLTIIIFYTVNDHCIAPFNDRREERAPEGALIQQFSHCGMLQFSSRGSDLQQFFTVS